jgi:CRP-like cAMP-binding protein
MGHLRAYYEQFTSIPESEWDFIAAHFVRREMHKNELITRMGETENYLSFIETGMLRLFIPEEERELTFDFAFDKEFCCAYDSFLTQTPSSYSLQTMKHTVLWQISHESLQLVYAQTSVGNYLGRFAAEKLFLAKSKRELSLLKYTAKERYLNLFEEHPKLLQNVPLKYLASYLGITPQGLSRIRKHIS